MPENNVIVEEEVKYYVFVKEGRRHYDPQYIAAGLTSVRWIFPTPDTNAVGTLDKHGNTIAIIKFGGYGAAPECKVIAQKCSAEDFDSYDYQFCPNFTEDLIAYSTIIDVIVVNVKTGESFRAEFGSPVDAYVTGIRFLDPQKNLLVVVKSIYEGNSGWADYLHIVKLEGQRFVDTGWNRHIGETRSISSEVPLYHTWFVHDRMLFVYDAGKILCTDGSQPVPHPFSEIFNENVSRIGVLKDFAIHPTLPFGVIFVEGVSMSRNFTVLRWDIAAPKKLDEQVSFNWDLYLLAPLFGLERMVLAYQSFSPDGNWYVVGCVAPEAPKDPYFVAVPVIPVDKKHPDFLDTDNLVVLGQVKGMASIAWTSEPTSYVVSNGELLHKWDLDELPAARVFVMPDGEDKRNVSFLGRIGQLFGKRGS